MKETRTKHRKFLISLLLCFLLIGTSLSVYAIATGQMPQALKAVSTFFGFNQPSPSKPQNIKPQSKESEVNSQIAPPEINPYNEIVHKDVSSEPEAEPTDNKENEEAMRSDEQPVETDITTEIQLPPTNTATHQPPTQSSNKPSKPKEKKTIVPQISGVNINQDTLTLNKNSSTTLTANILPKGAVGTIAWESSNDKIVTVDSNGRISTVSGGKAIITVTADGKYSDSCEVTVIVPIEKLQLNKTNLNLNKGDKTTLSAAVFPVDTTEQKEIAWSSSNSNIVSVVNGTVTAINEGKATITATCGKYTQSCIITVQTGFIAPPTYPISKVTLNKTELSLIKGREETLSLTIEPKNTTDSTTVTWTSSDPKIVTVDEKGHIKALAGGNTEIIAMVGKHKAVCKVKVIVPAEGIALNKSNLTLVKGTVEKLICTVFPEDSTENKVDWKSSDESFCTVDVNGSITAIKEGKATITASTKDDKYSVTCNVTVVIPVESIAINKNEITLVKGNTDTLTAAIAPADATDKGITWSSSNSNVATVDENGKVTALAGGSTEIIVTTRDGGFIAKCKVKVIVPVTGISLDDTSVILNKGTEKTLIESITPADATDKAVTWNSSNPTVATVDKYGKITAVNVGNTKITVNTHDGNFSAICDVTVVISVQSIALNKNEVTLIKGNTDTLTAAITPADATDKGITWSSSNPNIVTVDETGKVNAIAGGNAEIMAKTHDGGFIAKCKVTVIVPIESILITGDPNIIKGKSQQLSLTINPADTTEQKTITWSSSNDKIATVDKNGLVTGLSSGTAEISAKVGTHKSIFRITVKDIFSIQTKSNGNGSVTNGGNVIEDDSITLTATPNEHYHLINWTCSDGTSNSNPTFTYTPTASVTWTANFEIDSFRIKLISEGRGFVRGSGTFTYGSTVSISAVPFSNWRFVGWSDGLTDSSRKVTVTNDIYLNAIFKENPTGVATTDIQLRESCDIMIGSSYGFYITYEPTDATIKNADWVSSDPNIVSVNNNGTITAKSCGTAIITATAKTHGTL